MILKYEFNKITNNKTLIIILSILLLINAAICLYSSCTNILIPPKELSNFITLYKNNPQKILNEYNKYAQLQEEQIILWELAISNGNFSFEQTPVPDYFSIDKNYNDGDLYNELFTRLNIVNNYSTTISNVISQAQSNIKELQSRNLYVNDFLYNKQLKSIQFYQKAISNVTLHFEYTSGWDRFFLYSSVDIFIYIAIIVVNSIIFTQEVTTGMSSILYVTQKGRKSTAISKICTSLFFSIIIVLLFLLETFLIIGGIHGYSNISNGIQIIKEFTYCPIVITIGEYFILFLFTKIATFSLIGLTIVLFSCILPNYVFVFVFGLCFYGLNFILHIYPYLNAHNIFYYLNLITTASVNPLFKDFSVVNIFNNAIFAYPIAYCFLFSAILISIILIIWLYSTQKSIKSSFSVTLPTLPRHSKNPPERNTSPSKSTLTLSTLSYEYYKLLISNRCIFLILIAITIKLFMSFNLYAPQNSYTDAVYKEYMTSLAGELTEDKHLYIQNERQTINQNISNYALMQNKYSNKEISLTEYGNYLRQYTSAINRDDILHSIEKHETYITKQHNSGNSAWFVYDTGWNTWFFSSFDWSLYVLILLIFAGIFTNEYQSQSSAGNFVSILRTTYNGRIVTWRKKYIVTITISIFLSLIWNLIDFLFISWSYDLPLFNAPILSIQAFENFPLNISILEYLILFLFLKTFAILSYSCLLCSLSSLFHNHIIVLTITTVVTLIPSLLAFFKLSFFNTFDFISFTQVTPFLLNGSQTLLYILLWIIFSITTTTFSRRKWII